MAAVSATTSRPSRSRRSCRVATYVALPLTMSPLGFGSAGFFYRRHRPHRDRHISRSQYEDGRRRAFRGSPANFSKAHCHRNREVGQGGQVLWRQGALTPPMTALGCPTQPLPPPQNPRPQFPRFLRGAADPSLLTQCAKMYGPAVRRKAER